MQGPSVFPDSHSRDELDGDTMNSHFTIDIKNDEGEPTDKNSNTAIPMPAPGGIQALREKLHARMAALREGRRYGRSGNNVGEEASDKDGLLEVRRQQRATLREKRRKATKEKILREEEMKGKRDKGKGKDQEGRNQRDKGPQTKVYSFLALLSPLSSWIFQTHISG
jgi:hypothetical protein